MSVKLMHPGRPRLALESTLAGEPAARRRSGNGRVGVAARSLFVGLILGLLFAWRETASPATTLLLGAGVVGWAVLSFIGERPSTSSRARRRIDENVAG